MSSMVCGTGFNSRTREGCDVDDVKHHQTSNVSIHAPGRGATRLTFRSVSIVAVSIHAPGRGATSDR